ncbi:MAG: hypothetical protein Q9219_005035 [cf. Caloplaca sp. 3 TL-2023]
MKHTFDYSNPFLPLHHFSAISRENHSDTLKVMSAPETPITEKLCPISLTPPTTPQKSGAARVTAKSESCLVGQDARNVVDPRPDDAMENSKVSSPPSTEEMLCWEKTVPRPYTKNYQRQGSASSGYHELGHGAWSTVYRATERSPPLSSPLPTPPSSPVSGFSKADGGHLLAVKTAARRDARDILYREARVLTYLHSSSHASRYLVPFHGYEAASQSLVMDAVVLNLDAHAKACLRHARSNFSTRTMFDPVCGNQEWQSLAAQLVDGLLFLHSNHCVHGDIKPANILLRPDNGGPLGTYTALYCDFSSSHIFGDHNQNKSDESQQLTALTADFASPELLTSLHNPSAVATTASDVYALGVTMVIVAIGTSPYGGASMEIQKLSMAREGRVLDFARQCEQGTRIMKGKKVDQCLKHALEKDAYRRSTAAEWKREIDAVFAGSG